ncbi:polysaccharide lyase family 7 protein [uncultured Algibacter sp.]|uniref:polysaccharide lyase family 7 protein n=1 Tax=uncultured Algibacter sp. TaxID=298659 RepID=UPI00262AC70A|nr:polysaccharide lyase family 7 protein [uncultured Algibacter sp.]
MILTGVVLMGSACEGSSSEIIEEELVDKPILKKDEEKEGEETEEEGKEETTEVTFKLPNIDLANWKVTLPIGSPTEVLPPQILDYGNNDKLKPFFYNDSINGALVFYTYPESSTANSSYSRTELRELMNPEDKGKTNWTFEQGGNMKGTLQMSDISKDKNGKYHRSIIMQIHGRLTNAQRDLIGQKDNNAPPILKIYWTDGKVRVKTKVLKDLNASDIDVLRTNSWGDDEGYTFSQYVGFDKFTLEVKVEKNKMEVILNEQYVAVYNDIHMEKWGVFENYFKAGNYLSTTDSEAFSKVKYYELKVSH